MQSMGYRDSEWVLCVFLLMGGAVLWMFWKWCGPVIARALFVMRVERQRGCRLVHRDLAALERLRSGIEVEPASRAVVEGWLACLVRYVRALVQIVAGVGIFAGLMLVVVEGLPLRDQVSRWNEYQRVELLLTWVEVGSRSRGWLGGGQVDGVPVRFVHGELEAVLGPAPSVRSDPGLADLRARLPTRTMVLWNGGAQRRLLNDNMRREVLDEKARWVTGLCAWLIGIGVLLALLSNFIKMPVKRKQPRRSHKRARQALKL